MTLDTYMPSVLTTYHWNACATSFVQEPIHQHHNVQHRYSCVPIHLLHQPQEVITRLDPLLSFIATIIFKKVCQ